MKWINAARIALMSFIIVLVLRVTVEPFYHWCVGIYEDAVQIMEMLKYRTDRFSWLDADIFENVRTDTSDEQSGMTGRELPE